MELRVDQGRKSANDIRIMARTPGGEWIAICLSCVALQVDMVFDAEDIAQEREKYKNMRTFRGWVKFRDFLKDMRLMGPKLALAKYQEENAQTQIPFFIEADENGNA
jgi:hypothetical protein